MASQYGAQANVDPKVILALIQAESGGNPQAVGDAGHSVGLFQLHDHGAGAGLSVADRMNPIVQFNRFFPTIANAYHAGLSLGLSGTELADYTGMHAERPAASGKGRYGAAYDNLVGFLGAGNNGVTNGATLPPQLNLNSPTGGATPTTIIPAQTGGIITAPTSGTPVSTSTTAPAGGGAAGTTTGTSGQKIPKTAPGSVGRFVDVITGKYNAGEGSNQIISSFLDKNGKPILINGVVLIVGVLIVLISIGALVFKGGAKLEEKTGLISKGAKAALAAAV